MWRFLVVFLFTSHCFAQEVPNHTWKIVIKDSLSADRNFELVNQTLKTNGFSIESKDLSNKSVRSSMKQIDNSSITYFFKFEIRDGVIEVAGELNPNTAIYINGVKTQSTFITIENWGGRFTEVFNKMNDFALKLRGSHTYIFD